MVAAAQSESGGSSSDAGTLVTDTIADWNQMKADRANNDTLFDQVARFVCPRKGNIQTKFAPGTQINQQIYDTTADSSGKIFAAGVISSITPAGEKWAKMQPKGDDKNPAMAEWTDQSSDVLMAQIYGSNFYKTWHETLLDAGWFNTSCFYLEEGKKSLLNFIPIACGTYAFAENSEGYADKVGREWKWTARQAKQKWGVEKLGKLVRDALNSRVPTDQAKKFTFVHMVQPREGVELVRGFAAPNKRPWSSLYICVEDQHLIEEGGYYEMPYFINRLLKSNDELWGRGPGLDMLPEIKMVNAMRRDFLVAVEKVAQPGWVMSDDSDYLPDNRPNGITYYTDASKKPEQIENKADLNWAKEEIQASRDVIKEAFYVPMFQMFTSLEEQKREKTAAEVYQMTAEKLVLFSPLFARLCDEMLNPCLERCVGILARNGMLPPLPAEIAEGAQYELVYTSKISLALKAAENQSVTAVMALLQQLFEMEPSVRNLIKIPESVRLVMRNLGLPSDLINTQREYERRTAADNAAIQAQQQAQQAEMLSKSAANLGPAGQQMATDRLQAQAQNN